MQIRFPKDPEAWNVYVERLLAELRTDYDRLWAMGVPVPDPEAGLPFTGPLAPEHFVFFPQEGSGSRSASIQTGFAGLSGTTAGCPDYTLVTISGASGGLNCADCSALNGTHILSLYEASVGVCRYRISLELCNSVAGLTAHNDAFAQRSVEFSLGSQFSRWVGVWPAPGQSSVFSLESSTGDFCGVPATISVQAP